MSYRSLLRLSVLSAILLCAGAACGSGGDSKTKAPTVEPTATAATLPAPVPVELNGVTATIGSPDEPISRVALASFQKSGADITALEVMLIPIAGKDEGFLILDFEPSKAKADKDPSSTLKAIQEIAGLDILKRAGVNRIAIVLREPAAIRSVSMPWEVFAARMQDVPPIANIWQYLLATPNVDSRQSTDPAVQAAATASVLVDQFRNSEAVRRRALVSNDPKILEDALNQSPYNSKYYLYKAAQEVGFGGDANRTKGQALYLFQKQQAPSGTYATGPVAPEVAFLIRYNATVLDRILALNYDPKAQAYLNLRREFCSVEKLLITYKQPASSQCA